MSGDFRKRLFDGVSAVAYLAFIVGIVFASWVLLGLLVGVAAKAAQFVLGV